MSQKLLDHSPDLQKIRDEGYELEIRGPFAMVHHVPYVNSNKEITYGTLVSKLTLSGEATLKPDDHVMYFIGDHPCDKYGNKLMGIAHQSITQSFGEGITINHSFSNKPTNGYDNYYDKFMRYMDIITSQAISLNPGVTARTYQIPNEKDNNVFVYSDTNSGRASILKIAEKLKNYKIGIVGLGGTGSYVLDFIAKTPVDEIHLFDGDLFSQHNAFRSPGAPSINELRECKNKADYYLSKYSEMHKRIYSHSEYIDEENIQVLSLVNFVFICIDQGTDKHRIIEYLSKCNVPFIDTGIGLNMYDNQLFGHVRTTIGLPGLFNKANKHIDRSAAKDDNPYQSNIQIAELNALNACFAVIQWKKINGFYQDQGNYLNVVYSVNDGELFNEAITL